MSRTNIKRYLMLLGVIGLVAFASGGAGTFASFNAQVTNSGNTFATGTLILNDNGGTNTCTSEAGTLNTGTSSCDTLFNVSKFSFASTTYAGGSPLTSAGGASDAITIAATTGAAIYPGDTLTITQGSNTESLPALSYAAVGATTVTVNASGLTNSYTSGATITDNNDTYLADLTLTNAGSLDANGVKFEAGGTPCTAQYTEGSSTLNMATVTPGASSTGTLTFASTTAGAFHSGDPVVISEAGHYQTFIATGTATTTTVAVTAQNWNYAYDTSATISGPQFNGASSQNLCSNLAFSITETTSSFSPALTGAAACAYGSTSGTLAGTNSCNFGSSTALSSLPTSLTPLTLASAGGTGNSGTLLSAGGSRYFLLAVHFTGSGLSNLFQNTEATAFSLTWHIDQV